MNTANVALITYTIREHCQTEADFALSMEKVAAIGYRAVQISGVGPIPPGFIRTVCEDNGLAICATHEKGAMIVEEPQKVADRLHTLGTTHTAYPFPHQPLTTVEEVRRLTGLLNAAGEVLANVGMTLSYHNHNHELIRLEDGRTPLEVIYAETNPALLKAEFDVYWLQAGGASPIGWISRMAGRMPLLHIKDAGTFMNEEGKPELRFASIGDGNMEWKPLLAAATESGVEWIIVEQDKHWINNDPFEAAKRSLDYLASL